MTACPGDNRQGEIRMTSYDEGHVKNGFPSVLEEFGLEDFTEAFFENNTLILVRFSWPHVLGEYLDFYTAYAESGKLKFLLEVTYPYAFGDTALDSRLFAVIVSNKVFNEYEIGEMNAFTTYTFEPSFIGPESIRTENCREWLEKIEKNAVKHRVGYASPGYYPNFGGSIWRFRDNHPGIVLNNEIIVISSVESLHEYFIAGAAE
jgi:hypothetical protein